MKHPAATPPDLEPGRPCECGIDLTVFGHTACPAAAPSYPSYLASR